MNAWFLDIVRAPDALVLVAVDADKQWVERETLADLETMTLVEALSAIAARRTPATVFVTDYARYWSEVVTVLRVERRLLNPAEQALVERMGRFASEHPSSDFDNPKVAQALAAERKASRGFPMPRFGLVPNCTPGLDDCEDPNAPEFDGRSLVIVWGSFAFEIFLGKRA